MKKIFLFVLGLFCAEAALFAQNSNWILDLDSSHVEVNAIAYREYNGTPQYVLMPTQHNGNVNHGDVFFITLDANAFSIITSYRLRGLQGLVVNSIEITSSNEILFAGTQNNCGVFGALSASGSINWVKKDTSLRDVAAMELLESGSARNVFFTGSSSAANMASGRHTVSQANVYYMNATTPNIARRDAIILKGTTINNSYGIVLGQKGSNEFVVTAQRLNASSILANSSRAYPLPANITWASDKGCLTAIAPQRFIAAIPIRNSVLQKDGILLVKFAFSTTSGISLVSNKVLYFPSPKVLINDIVFINQPDENDVTVNVMGQYLDTYAGQPFMVKIDTNFINHEALLYAGTNSDYLYRNFQLKQGVYNADNYELITAGSYQAYGTMYPLAGFYMTKNSIGADWGQGLICATSLSLIPTTLTFNNDTQVSMGRLLSKSLYSLQALRHQIAYFDDLEEYCYGKKDNYQHKPKISKNLLSQSDITMTNDNYQLSFKNLPENCQYVIVNALGQELKKGIIVDTTIGISDLYSGVYVVKVTQNNQVAFTAKFVKL